MTTLLLTLKNTVSPSVSSSPLVKAEYTPAERSGHLDVISFGYPSTIPVFVTSQ